MVVARSSEPDRSIVVGVVVTGDERPESVSGEKATIGGATDSILRDSRHSNVPRICRFRAAGLEVPCGSSELIIRRRALRLRLVERLLGSCIVSTPATGNYSSALWFVSSTLGAGVWASKKAMLLLFDKMSKGLVFISGS